MYSREIQFKFPGQQPTEGLSRCTPLTASAMSVLSMIQIPPQAHRTNAAPDAVGQAFLSNFPFFLLNLVFPTFEACGNSRLWTFWNFRGELGLNAPWLRTLRIMRVLGSKWRSVVILVATFHECVFSHRHYNVNSWKLDGCKPHDYWGFRLFMGIMDHENGDWV